MNPIFPAAYNRVRHSKLHAKEGVTLSEYVGKMRL